MNYDGVTYTVTSIGRGAFQNSKYSSVTIPNTVISIKGWAFNSCSNIEHLTFGENIEYIGDCTFAGCNSLTSVIIPNSVKTIDTGAFKDCNSLSSIHIGAGVIEMSNPFTECDNLLTITVHDANPTFDSRNNCNAVIRTQNNELIIGCKNSTIPQSVTSIGNHAFNSCRDLTTITIPECVATIGEYVFYNCANLSRIDIPNSVYSIGNWSFYDCVSLSRIVVRSNNPPTISNVTFPNEVYDNATLYVPDKTNYESSTYWKKFKNIKLLEEDAQYVLTITSSGNGVVSFNGVNSRNTSRTYNVVEGTNATLTLTPDNGYKLASLKVNNTNVTSSVTNNKYTISNIQKNTTVVATFEEIPPTYYNLTLTASGGGMITYNGVNTRNTTRTNSVVEGTNATLTFTPDNGYRLASLKVNNTNVTSSVTNNKYTISNIQRNTTVVATFEEIPPTYYNLTLTASGSGMITYNGVNTRNTTRTNSVIEGTNATLTLTPDNGYRLASLKVNNTNVTSSVTNNKYTISNIQRNTTVVATFEEIPPTYYNLTLTASGSGMITYNGVNTRNTTRTNSVVEGTNATLTFTPDNGYRLASVRVNNSDVTASVLNNSYTIKNIRQNTTVSAIFEQTPTTFYTLSITAAGNGSVSYGTTNVRGGAKNISVSEGTNATITFTPDNGYRLASLKVNSTDVTANVSNNAYTISNIRRNTTVSATFEQIPVATFDLKITATGNGRATYDGYDIRNNTWTFSRDRGTNCIITFTPDEGNRIASVTMNGSIVNTSSALTISDMNENKIVVVTFVLDEQQENTFTEGGINYSILSSALKNVAIANGNYSGTLAIPRTVTHGNTTWNVVAIADKAFYNCSSLQAIEVPSCIQSVGNDLFTGCLQLSAIQWNSSARLTEAVMGTVTNPNLLLYVSNRGLAPSTINNVVVNGTAESIRLSDAVSGNNFFCPIEFTAKEISYTHRFGMTSGRGTCQGWETLVLPFDVQEVKQGSTVLSSFVTWSGDRWTRPFWLYGMTNAGFRSTGSIRANTPYIISMPNNTSYDAEWNISGDVTFSATQAKVYATTQLTTAKYNGKTFTPCYTERPSGGQVYALNVNNLLGNHANGYAEGSVFVNAPARMVHPFEAYLEAQTASAKTAFSIFEDMTEETPTGMLTKKAVYNLSGQLVKLANATSPEEAIDGLPAGIYIVDGKKVVRATP
ncbi:MAG: leucine-rich repeat protein [Prevotella sp.]|nr:leucine-rich repeat protein [Prevotella sp.]